MNLNSVNLTELTYRQSSNIFDLFNRIVAEIQDSQRFKMTEILDLLNDIMTQRQIL